MRILPLSTIDDNRTILQEVLRLRKYLEENPIRNWFYIDTDYIVSAVAYDVTLVAVNHGLDVQIASDDILLFKNGYSAIVDSVGSEYVTIVSDSVQGTFGPTGVGISGVAKTGTSGLVDTYTITLTNGSTYTFTVTNGTQGETGATGIGISNIAKTGTSGLVDTYTITMSDNSTYTFTVTNGTNGVGISGIVKTGTSGLVDTYTITYTNGTTSTFTVTNGANGTNGQGVPTGGTTGQMLVKNSGTDFDTKWVDPPSGGGSFALVNNLLINHDFKINQRGSAGGTANDKYYNDRWISGSSDTDVNYSNGFFSIGNKTEIGQFIEHNVSSLGLNKTFLIVVDFESVDINNIAFEVGIKRKLAGGWTEIPATIVKYTSKVGDDTGKVSQLIALCSGDSSLAQQSEQYFKFYIRRNDEYTYKIKIIDTYIGVYESLSSSVYNVVEALTIPHSNYNDELEKCKYYYEKIGEWGEYRPAGIERTSSSSYKLTGLIHGHKKRINPTITDGYFSGTLRDTINSTPISPKTSNGSIISPYIAWVTSYNYLTWYNPVFSENNYNTATAYVHAVLDAEIYP